ncbi:hypothetical protein EDD17DRAFT_1767839 [Pisolithus thermaeus]|nr:hypothetical protein EDD17DRAFT_1767839 [Pisolithus thermaeus]
MSIYWKTIPDMALQPLEADLGKVKLAKFDKWSQHQRELVVMWCCQEEEAERLQYKKREEKHCQELEE